MWIYLKEGGIMSHVTPEELDVSLRRVKKYIDESGTHLSPEPDENILEMIHEIFGSSNNSNSSDGQ